MDFLRVVRNMIGKSGRKLESERSANHALAYWDGVGLTRGVWGCLEHVLCRSVVGNVNATSRKSVIEDIMCDIVKGLFNDCLPRGHLCDINKRILAGTAEAFQELYFRLKKFSP